MIEVFVTALLGTIVAQVSPGPNLLAVASTGLAQGRQRAIAVAAGVATGVWVWAFAFAAGLNVLFSRYPDAGNLLRITGGCYLLYLALKAIVSALKNRPTLFKASGDQLSVRGAYFRGILVVLTNPKAAMMWAALSAYLVSSGLSTPVVLSFTPIASLTAMIIYGAYGFAFSTSGAQRLYASAARSFEFVFGAMFGLIGGKLLIDGLREIRSS